MDRPGADRNGLGEAAAHRQRPAAVPVPKRHMTTRSPLARAGADQLDRVRKPFQCGGCGQVSAQPVLPPSFTVGALSSHTDWDKSKGHSRGGMPAMWDGFAGHPTCPRHQGVTDPPPCSTWRTAGCSRRHCRPGPRTGSCRPPGGSSTASQPSPAGSPT